MPAASLSPEELARVALGNCACGCGRRLPEALPGEIPPRARLYALPRCQARAYRARRKAGRVVGRDERVRLGHLEQARVWNIKAREAGLEKARWSRIENDYLSKAARCIELATGQTYLPGFEPKEARRGKK